MSDKEVTVLLIRTVIGKGWGEEKLWLRDLVAHQRGVINGWLGMASLSVINKTQTLY